MRDHSQIVVDATAVRSRMEVLGVTPKEIETLSHKRVMGQVVRRALNGRPITCSLAQHLAEALGCRLDDLKKDAVRTHLGDHLMHDKETSQ